MWAELEGNSIRHPVSPQRTFPKLSRPLIPSAFLCQGRGARIGLGARASVVVHASPWVTVTPLGTVNLTLGTVSILSTGMGRWRWILVSFSFFLHTHSDLLKDSKPSWRCTVTRPRLGNMEVEVHFWLSTQDTISNSVNCYQSKKFILASICLITLVLFLSWLRTWEGRRTLKIKVFIQ